MRISCENIDVPTISLLVSAKPKLGVLTEERFPKTNIDGWLQLMSEVEDFLVQHKMINGSRPSLEDTNYLGSADIFYGRRKISLALVSLVPKKSTGLEFNGQFLQEVPVDICSSVMDQTEMVGKALMISTDAWRDENGRQVWFGADNSGMAVNGKLVNQCLVRCVQAALAILKESVEEPIFEGSKRIS